MALPPRLKMIIVHPITTIITILFVLDGNTFVHIIAHDVTLDGGRVTIAADAWRQ